MINNIIKPDECRVSEISDIVNGPVGFQKTIFYQNYTDEVMYIRDRSGTVAKLNPTTGLHYRGEAALVIRMQLNMDHVSAKHNYERVLQINADERSFIDKLFLDHYGPIKQRNYQPLSLSVVYVINKQQLIGDRGISFIEATDTLAFIGQGISYVESEYIPGTKDAAIDRFHQEMKEVEDVSFDTQPFVFMVRIIDNESATLPTFWTNVGNRVYSIRAERSDTLESGIYMINREQETNSRASNLIACFYDHRQYRQLEDFPIYTSHDEALANPSHPQVKNHKDIVREQAAKALKAEHDAADARERIERDRIKFEQDKARQYEDLRATKRKNTFELFKYGPMIINGLIALTLIIISIVTKSPIKAPPIKI